MKFLEMHEISGNSMKYHIVRLVLCRAGGIRPWRIRRPSGVGVPNFNFQLAQFLAQLLAPSSWRHVLFFQVFEVLVPLQKSSPAPADPPAHLQNARRSFFFCVQETSSQNDIIIRFFGICGPFLPSKKELKSDQNR